MIELRPLLFATPLLICVNSVMAQEITYDIDIPAQSLSSALDNLARQADIKPFFSDDLVAGKNSTLLKGRYTPQDALQKLLAGSGLTYTFTSKNAVAIKLADSGSDEMATLPVVKVLGKEDESNKENNLYNKSYTTNTASSATKTNTPLIEIPVSMQVVPKQVIKDKGMQAPNDLAEVVSGVQPIVGYGNAPSQWFLIRGFSNDSLNYRNGFRLTEKYTPRDLANVERVEFAKGPASVLYGSNQPGGAVNTITKKPLDIDFVSTNLTGGSFSRFRGTVDANKKIGNLGLRLNVAGDRADSYFDFENSQNWFLAPVITYQFTPSTKFLYEAEFQETKQNGWNNGLPNYAGSYTLPINRTMSEPSTFVDNFNHTHHIDIEHSFNDDWRIRQGFYYSRTDRNILAVNGSFSRNPLSDGDSLLSNPRYVQQYPDEHQQNIVAQTELHGKFITGEVEHQVIAGFETIHSIFTSIGDFSELDTGFNLQNPVYSNANLTRAPTFGSKNTADANAGYLQDQIKWRNWRLLTGWRHDEVDTGTQDTFKGDINRQSEGADTGRVGLMYMITPKTSVYYSFSQSFSPNLGTDFNRNLFLADRGNQHEVGLKHSLLTGLDFTLSLFDINRENVIGRDPNNPGFSQNNGEQSSQGIETSLIGDVTPDLHLITNLTWMDTKVEAHSNPTVVGNSLYGVPHFSANAWGVYDLPLSIPGKLSGAFGIVHLGDREATLPNYGLELPAYTRFDIGMFYKYKNMRLNFNLRNLTNEKYYETLENFAVQAQAPRNWAVTVGYDF